MSAEPGPDTPQFLTTREVADLLRVKERKVYDLAAAEAIPHRRLTGKLLFPRDQLLAWIAGSSPAPAPDRPPVLGGSHDPLLDWAARESDAGLATLFTGSAEGVDRFAAGEVAATGMHVPEDDGWNRGTVAARDLTGCVLVGWAVRSRGLILAPGTRIAAVADLRGRRVALRQPGAGATALLDRLLAGAGLSQADLSPAADLARTENDAAAAVAGGDAEAALGIAAMARRYSLPFLPLLDEQFDLLIDRRAYFTDPMQRLLRFAQGAAVRDKAASMGGYDMADCGVVRWLSP